MSWMKRGRICADWNRSCKSSGYFRDQAALYFRDQAALCLEIARHVDDAQAVANLRARASRHLAKADDAESRLCGAPIH
jgi:hypothetical protein